MLPSNALTTVADLQSLPGLSALSTAAAERLIGVASDLIEGYCQRKLVRGERVTRVDGSGGRTTLYLPHTPVASVTSWTVDDVAQDVADLSILDGDAGEVALLGGALDADRPVNVGAAADRPPGYGRPLVAITYQAGYITPAQVAADPALVRTLPYDLEQACLDLAAHTHLGRGRDRGIKAEAMGETSVQYDTSAAAGGIPPAIAQVLRPYARIV